MNKIKSFFKITGQILMAAFKGFQEDRIMKLSAALAYYTLFSITPLIIIVISAAGILYGENITVQKQLFGEINELIGQNGANAIEGLVANASLSGKSNFALTVGIILLIVGGTTIFIEIQDSINLIWKVKAIPKKGWVKLILNRLVSFSLIVSLGFLLLVSLIINSIVIGLGAKLEQVFPNINSYILILINNAITLSVVTVIFTIIFKVLPDVILKWKTAIIGALFTALLFSLGKYLIGIYIEMSDPGSAFGSAGSIVIILVWIYYTAVILYFGAEFTQAYAEKMDNGIEPSKYAVHLETIIIQKKVDVLPDQHSEKK
ncbi:YihY/virulence factor BrkB family protein [Pedobacter flavus]|uniref:YihY/virulence factor BrkB family protein n=1 Tax=Pedobacter flavus TaxID=3113906 RepID=A0ABU7H1G0_9SPHI|nr:YihY/virulence factor BrkB family protein [Pedobacter sp. VNH31]MEE1885081.1 YihY/virulence factor BrkB family protein [Pedobacter sp. VNH31]